LQNDSNELGNYELPTNLKTKIRKINYPKLEYNEILGICNKIEREALDFFFCGRQISEISNCSKNNELIVKCMLEINKEKLFPNPWTIKDIVALIKILQYQKNKNKIFSNFKLEHNLLFYALFEYSINDKNNFFNKLCKILQEILSLNNQEFNDLKTTYHSQTQLIEIENDLILRKNNLSITLRTLYFFRKIISN